MFLVESDSAHRTRSKSQAAKTSTRTCGVCFEGETDIEFVAFDCGHAFCEDCWRSYFKIEVEEGECEPIEPRFDWRVVAGKTRIVCMEPKCGIFCSEDNVRKLLPAALLQRYEQALYRETITANPCFAFCPGADCPVVVVSESMKPHRVICKQCKTQFW